MADHFGEDQEETTPLYYALKRSSREFVELYIRHGVEVPPGSLVYKISKIRYSRISSCFILSLEGPVFQTFFQMQFIVEHSIFSINCL